MAKKSLGQHFLNAPGVIAGIIKAGNLRAGDCVLEIGPGKGVLTRALLETGARVVAIEKDDWLSAELRETFKEELERGQLILRNADFIKTSTPEIEEGKYKVIANIPYNITGLILRNLFERTNQPTTIVLMIQREVADRILAREKKESLVGISVKVYGTPHYIRRVLPGSFNPPPKVESAVVAITDITKDAFTDILEERFFKVVKAGFGSKRKQLKNNLKHLATEERLSQAFNMCDILPDTRAENLSVEKWICLTKNL